MIIANDIGTARYKKNSQKNQIVIVDSEKNIVSSWMNKEKIAKIIKKQIEIKLK
jgi:phosphopantothenoylcysteine decarboxylase/phosphopantothenate--cysteine ligase